jgi:hypothetical protein
MVGKSEVTAQIGPSRDYFRLARQPRLRSVVFWVELPEKAGQIAWHGEAPPGQGLPKFISLIPQAN